MPIKGSAHHSRCVVRFRTHAADTSPLGQRQKTRPKALTCFQKTDATVKDHAPRGPARHTWHSIGPTKGSPAWLRGKEQVPEGTGSRICSRTALHFRRPGTTPEGIIDQAGRSNRSAAGGLTWCLKAPVSRSRSGLPRREPPRGGHRRWCLPAPASRPGHPGPFEEGPPFGVHQRWCVPAELQGLEIQAPARRESSLSGRSEMVPLDPHFKTSAVRSPRRRPLAVDA
jgi:hypothetical protein